MKSIFTWLKQANVTRKPHPSPSNPSHASREASNKENVEKAPSILAKAEERARFAKQKLGERQQKTSKAGVMIDLTNGKEIVLVMEAKNGGRKQQVRIR